MDYDKCFERIDYYSNLRLDKLKKQIISYLNKCKEENIVFENWDRRNERLKEIQSQYIFLNSNDYIDDREVNEFKMMKDIGKNNNKNWLMLVEYDMELCLFGYDETFLDKIVNLIKILYKLQDELGFILCIKYSKSVYKEKCGLESRTCNVQSFSNNKDMIYKYSLHNCKPWFLFIIPK